VVLGRHSANLSVIKFIISYYFCLRDVILRINLNKNIHMNLNLISNNSDRVNLDTIIDIPVDIYNNILNLYPKEKFGEKYNYILFGGKYVIRKKIHYSAAIVWKDKKKDPKTAIKIIYKTKSDPLLSELAKDKELKPISELLSILLPLNTDVNFDSAIDFLYSHTKFEPNIIELPIQFKDSSYFDEIRGVRVTKLEKDEQLYTVIIDRPDNKAISHSVRFNYKTKLKSDVLNLVFEYGKNISERFVYGKKRT
jgi:hypothetical protein